MSLVAAGLVIAMARRGPAPRDPDPRCLKGTARGNPAIARYEGHGGAPDRVIEGSHTLLCHPGSVAVGPGGEIFVIDQTDFSVVVPNTGPTWDPAVLVFDSAAQGDVAPVRTMIFPHESYGVITGIGLDHAGHVYILSYAGTRLAPLPGGSIRVYDARASGVPQPVRIFGSGGGLQRPSDIAFDSRGNLYVSDDAEGGTGRILVFGPDADGGATPLRIIDGPETLLRRPHRLAVGPGDTLYVLNAFYPWWPCAFTGVPNTTVTIYAPGASGDVEPVRSISVTENGSSPGRKYGYVAPRGLVVDPDGSVYVWMSGTEALVYGPGSSGFVAPSRVIEQTGRERTDPTGITGIGSGLIYQAFVPGLAFCL